MTKLFGWSIINRGHYQGRITGIEEGSLRGAPTEHRGGALLHALQCFSFISAFFPKNWGKGDVAYLDPPLVVIFLILNANFNFFSVPSFYRYAMEQVDSNSVRGHSNMHLTGSENFTALNFTAMDQHRCQQSLYTRTSTIHRCLLRI